MRRSWLTLVTAGCALLAFGFLAAQIQTLRQENRALVAQLADAAEQVRTAKVRQENQARVTQLAGAATATQLAGAATATTTPPSAATTTRNIVSPLYCTGVHSIPRGSTSGHIFLKEPPAACRKFVAVVVPVTSRSRQTKTSVAARSASAISTTMKTSAVVTKLFSSVVETLADSHDVGFDVAFYIGYDASDLVWDTDTARHELPTVLKSKVMATYASPQKKNLTHVGMSVKMVHCYGGTMVSASNCAISHAYEDGAEYWYRVNDDTVLGSKDWIRDFNTALLSFDPPNVGVVGPLDNQNDRILTYDYVHRTHWEIFHFQYPPFLRNWYCDDWITYVYGAYIHAARDCSLSLGRRICFSPRARVVLDWGVGLRARAIGAVASS